MTDQMLMELNLKLDAIRDALLQVLAKLDNAPAARANSEATPRKKFPAQLNGQDVWVYDVDGMDFIDDKNLPGRKITFATTKNGKKIPVDTHGIVVFDEEYDTIRTHVEANSAS